MFFFLHVPPPEILKDWTAWKTSRLSSLEMLPEFSGDISELFREGRCLI